MQACLPFSGRKRRDERGAAMVEFVVVVPFFLFLIFFLVGIATSFSYRQTLSQAATEGARAGAVPVGLTSAVRQQKALDAVNSAVKQSGALCNAGQLVCTVSQSTVNGEDVVTVSVSRDLKAHPLGGGATVAGMPLISDVLPDKVGYTASARVSR